MKSIRLLPVVILASLALLILKGTGLLLSGGYVLLGPRAVQAATEQVAEAGGETPEMTLPDQPTMTDSSPTLDDAAPTLAPEGAAVADAHGAEAAGAEEAGAGEDGHPAEGQEHEAALEGPLVPDLGCAVGTAPHDGTAAEGDDCLAPDGRAEAVPMEETEGGENVPLTGEDGGSLTESVVLERLSARRAELDAREEELDLRLDLVEAAEAKLEERAAALAALEARINALVDQQSAAGDAQFAAIIKMYEQMKPSEAAAIFNQLDMQVLVRVARGMNPRKMAPALAKMTPARAQELTLALAAIEPEPTIQPDAVEDLASLPQIVGE